MSAKIIFPLFVGVAGVSAATATTISAGVFSPKKCWYDGEKDGSFLAKVEEVLQKNYPDKDNSEVKDLIKSLCTKESGISLSEFEEFKSNDYPDVFKLLIEKRSSIEKSKKRLD